MIHDVVMPQLGMTMTEGSVVRWLKNKGESIRKGEILFEVETDKVTMEVESTTSGSIQELLVEVGKVVPVGSVIARISDSNPDRAESIVSAAPNAAAGSSDRFFHSSATEGAPMQVLKESVPGNARILASPRARRLARELGVDIAAIKPSYNRGTIVEADVWDWSRSAQSATLQPAAVRTSAEVHSVSASRRAIASRMAESSQKIPHFYLNVQADAEELCKLRERLLPVVERRAGVRLSFTDLMIKALALALREYPNVNVSWQEDGIAHLTNVNVGFAVQTRETLLVPVIRDADQLPIGEIARVRSALADKAGQGKIALADIEGASVTLSNLGSYGIDQFHAIINPPQSAILAVGRIAMRPVVREGQILARSTVSLTLSVDHRAVDGVAGAALLAGIVSAIESPYTLLVG